MSSDGAPKAKSKSSKQPDEPPILLLRRPCSLITFALKSSTS